MITIGSEYLHTLSKLREKIRNATATHIEKEAENHACYFCGKKITGKMNVLVEKESIKGYESESKFIIDKKCYEMSKLYFYSRDMPLSIN